MKRRICNLGCFVKSELLVTKNLSILVALRSLTSILNKQDGGTLSKYGIWLANKEVNTSLDWLLIKNY